MSFGVLGLAWRESRFHGDDSGRPMWPWLARIVESRVTHAVVVVVALTYTAWVVMAAVFGKDILVNPTFGAAFVLLWVGLVPASLLFGPIYRLCNPLRWLHRGISAAAGTDYRRGFAGLPDSARALAGVVLPLRLRLAGAGRPVAVEQPVDGAAVVRRRRRRC